MAAVDCGAACIVALAGVSGGSSSGSGSSLLRVDSRAFDEMIQRSHPCR